MRNIQQQVVEWHRQTFPRATDQAIIDKLIEEAQELWSVDGEESFFSMVEEVADVIIVACALFDRWGLDLKEEVLNKLEINKSREWGNETANGDRPRSR